MINKINFKGTKPRKYYMNEKRIKRMVLNDDIIYEYVPCTGINITDTVIQLPTEGNKGDTYNISYSITPSDCTEPVIWSIEDNPYFTINNGIVTRLVGDIGFDEEEMFISISVSCESFNDNAKLRMENDNSCTSFRFNEYTVTIDREVIDDTYYKLKYTIEPEDCSDEVTWEISDPNIIKVTHSKGTKEFWITTLSMGSCTLTGRCGNKTDVCVIKVIDEHTSNKPCTGITCDPEVTVAFENVTPEVSGGVKINVQVTPDDTTDIVTCKVHANEMVYVLQQSDGWYVYSQGQKYGRTTVSFICGNHQADCIVTVR